MHPSLRRSPSPEPPIQIHLSRCTYYLIAIVPAVPSHKSTKYVALIALRKSPSKGPSHPLPSPPGTSTGTIARLTRSPHQRSLRVATKSILMSHVVQITVTSLIRTIPAATPHRIQNRRPFPSRPPRQNAYEKPSFPSANGRSKSTTLHPGRNPLLHRPILPQYTYHNRQPPAVPHRNPRGPSAQRNRPPP